MNRINQTQTVSAKKAPQASGEAVPKIAVIGCGAIAELYHLPALAKHPEVLERLILIDTDEVRVKHLAAQFGIAAYTDDYQKVVKDVDGAIITVPHHLHHKVSMAFLEGGVHVLCEKPLARSVTEAKEMVAQAEKAKVTLSVNHTRRLFPSYAKLKELLSQGKLGKLRSIAYTDGEPFQWPSASGFYFKKGSATGVLLDRGVHSLDTICWWLGAKPRVLSSQNDSFGGVEGVVLLELEHDGCLIDVKLNWLNKLDNTYRIVGELGTVEGGIEEWGQLNIAYASGKKEVLKLNAKEKTYTDFGYKMIDNFIEVVARGASPLVSGREVISGLEVIEDSYRAATQFEMPWYDTWKEFYETQ